MKHFLIILCTLACSLGMNAQNQNAQGLNMQTSKFKTKRCLLVPFGIIGLYRLVWICLCRILMDTISRRCSQKERPLVWMWRWEMVYAACGSARKGELGERTLYLQEQAPGMGGTG